MSALHFLGADLLGISAAITVFPIFTVLPGYAAGWLTNVFDFRQRQWPFRLAASVPISLSLAPVLGYTIGRWWGLNYVWLAYLILYACAVSAALRKSGARPRPAGSARTLLPFALLILVWTAVAIGSLADLPIGNRLYFSIIDFDYAVRIAFVHSIATFGIPAQNPFFFPTHAATLRYHYFWMIPCAQVERLGLPLIDSRTSFIAGTVWVGIGLISIIPIYLRLFSSATGDLLRRCRFAILLLAVTGLDIIPAYFMVLLNRIGLAATMSPSVEWWNDQIDGWLYTMLWEPHYVCALVAGLTGFLIVFTLPERSVRTRRVVYGTLAGFCFASATGCGIYIGLVFAAFLSLWMLVVLLRKSWDEAETLAIAGLVAAALLSPFLFDLRNASPPGAGPSLIKFTIRGFYPAELALAVFGITQMRLVSFIDLLLLPLNYFLELGVFSAAGWLMWTRFRKRHDPATRLALASFLLLGTSITICTFLKSSIIANNDLGWRGFLPAQFLLLLWAADLFHQNAARTPLVRLLLLIGLAGVLYDTAILRLYPYLSDLKVVPKIDWLGVDENIGLRTYANREAYEWVRTHSPETAIIQQNPAPTYQDTYWGAYGHRQTIAVGAECGSGFGGNSAECQAPMRTMTNLYKGSENLQAACSAYPVQFFLAKDTDAAWLNHASWVWKSAPEFKNRFVRLFRCPAR